MNDFRAGQSNDASPDALHESEFSTPAAIPMGAMNRPLLSSLIPPSFDSIDNESSPSGASPSAASAGGRIGRPTLWPDSAQRKMSRLYLYTTLSMTEIIKVVNATSPQGTTSPKKDSAQKKLNNLLDNQPRYLRAKNSIDMGRRLNQLSLSPYRSAQHAAGILNRRFYGTTTSPMFHNPLGINGMGSGFLGSPIALLASSIQSQVSPVVTQAMFTHPDTPGDAQLHPNTAHADSETLLLSFLRRTTDMSTGSDQTNGSFQRLLSGHSPPYVQAVRRLVKRFTLANVAPGMSPPTGMGPFKSRWLEDEDSPSVFQDGPFPLPGDFLSLDLYQQGSNCFPRTEFHVRRCCTCFAAKDIINSRWVHATGLTVEALRLLSGLDLEESFDHRDEFNNTVLHLLAARADPQILLSALQKSCFRHMLNIPNTAGQTFLHVLGQQWFPKVQGPPHTNEPWFPLGQLLAFLKSVNFDIGLPDHYGRNFFHLIGHLEKVPTGIFHYLLGQYDSIEYEKRDAFGEIPRLPAPRDPFLHRVPTQLMDLDVPSEGNGPEVLHFTVSDDPIVTDGELIAGIVAAMDHPTITDSNGRNALHWLAMTSLSSGTVMSRQAIHQNSQNTTAGRRRTLSQSLPIDSREDRLLTRLESLEVLLQANVDPNHYDNFGNTPLMAFVAELPEDGDHRKPPEILNMLLQRGANIHARNRRGETALHIAVRCGRKLAVKTLVDNNANVHARDADGRSVLDVADIKYRSANNTLDHAHFDACRAFLSGSTAKAVQDPTVLDEWGDRTAVNRTPL